MMKLAVFVMAVAIAATTVLSALPTSPERPMRTRIVKKVSGTPPASSKGAKITPVGSRTVGGSGSTMDMGAAWEEQQTWSSRLRLEHLGSHAPRRRSAQPGEQRFQAFCTRFRVPYPVFLKIVQWAKEAFDTSAKDCTGRRGILMELKV